MSASTTHIPTPQGQLDETLEASGASQPKQVRAVELPRGTLLQRYVVLEPLGTGGMGVVYAAYDPELDRKVAVKLVHADQGGRRGSAAATRLMLEAQAMAKLSHPNVIVVHDIGTFDEQVFIAMEHLDGGTLRSWVETSTPSWREIVDRFALAGEGLAAAHAADLVHRDFKPENVLLASDGRLRVMDFGLAIPLESVSRDDTSLAPATSFDSLPERLTRTGSVVGTPAYMAPEQHDGHSVDALSDQFAFCVALFEALYGQRPHEGNTMMHLAVAKRRGRIRPAPQDTEVPKHIDSALRRGLSPDPAERFASMRPLLAELRRDPTATRLASFRTAAVGLGLLTTAAVAFAIGGRQEPMCAAGHDRIGAVWNDEVRAATHDAFLAVDRPFSQDSFERTAGVLDAYAEQWAQMYRDACEATHVRGEQSERLLDLRMACLRRRSRQMEHLLALLTDADAQVVVDSDRLVAGLDSLDSCGDTPRLLGTPTPPDPETVQRVELAWSDLDEVSLLRDATRFDTAQARLDAIASEVDQLDYPPLRAQHQYLQGALAVDRGDWDRAEALTYEAAIAAAQAGDPELEATAWTSLIIQLGSVRRRYEAVVPLQKAAEAALARTPDSWLHRARLYAALGTVDLLRTRFDVGEDRLQEAVELYEELGRGSTPDGWEARQMLANIYHGQQRYRLATDTFEALAQEMTEALGQDHPLLAAVLGNWARSVSALGQPQEAIALQLRSLELLKIGWGPRGPHVSTLHSNLSRAYRRAGNLTAAREHFEAARDLDLQLYGRDSERHAFNLHDEGQLLMQEGKPSEALEAYRGAQTVFEAQLGADDPQVAYALTSVGRALLALGRADEAIAPLQRALAIREHDDNVPSEELQRTQDLLAQARGGAGRVSKPPPAG